MEAHYAIHSMPRHAHRWVQKNTKCFISNMAKSLQKRVHMSLNKGHRAPNGPISHTQNSPVSREPFGCEWPATDFLFGLQTMLALFVTNKASVFLSCFNNFIFCHSKLSFVHYPKRSDNAGTGSPDTSDCLGLTLVSRGYILPIKALLTQSWEKSNIAFLAFC